MVKLLVHRIIVGFTFIKMGMVPAILGLLRRGSRYAREAWNVRRFALITTLRVTFVVILLANIHLPTPQTRNLSEPCGIVLLAAAPLRRMVAEDGCGKRESGCVSLEGEAGFTLIELSIVLVIIGLIVGGILVGQDLIKGAATQAQISQIQKYNTAVHTFQTKYGFLPGDIPNPYATMFGFQARGTTAGEGDGNGIIMGNGGTGTVCNTCASGWLEGMGETATFWADLSTAGLIEGSYSGSPTSTPSCAPCTSSGAINQYFPQAKIGYGNYVYVWTDNNGQPNNYEISFPDNYYGISAVNYLDNNAYMHSTANIPVIQAYNVDKKIDDGLPFTGNVMTIGINSTPYLSNDNTFSPVVGDNLAVGPWNVAITPSAATCFDNGGNYGPNSGTSAMHYSTGSSANGGTGQNCALSFKFQ